jgi:hypothetical protein
MFVSCERCVLLSGRGLCDEPIPRPEESYRLWCVSQCDQKKITTSTLKRETGVGRRGRQKKQTTMSWLFLLAVCTTDPSASAVFSSEEQGADSLVC